MVVAKLIATALLAFPTHGVPAGAAQCEARSGPLVNPLVELYTSGRCAECPHAEGWLARLSGARPGLVALLWRIDEADYQPRARRGVQRRLTFRQRLALEHRPLVLLQGREVPRWDAEGFLAELARVAERPAPVELILRGARDDGRLTVQASIEFAGEESAETALYLAAYAEPAGQHAHRIALAWQGPFFLPPGTGLSQQHPIPLVPGATPERSGVAAFVQRRHGREVLQALTLPPCPA